jgi:hypothetical protein
MMPTFSVADKEATQYMGTQEFKSAHGKKMKRNEVLQAFGTRLSWFQESYDWEETDGLLRSFVVVGELLSTCFEPVTAARGMQALRLVVNTRPDQPIDWGKLPSEAPLNWEEIWEDSDGFNDSYWPKLMDDAHNLSAFAYYGILPTWALDDVDSNSPAFNDVPAVVRQTVANLTKFVTLLPATLKLYGIDVIERTCLAASGRLKIDIGEPLTVHELAAVTKVSTKRLQNAIYAKTSEAPVVNKADGLVPVATAQRWLDAREYLPSIWKEFIEHRCWELKGQMLDHASADDEEAAKESDDFLFVPVARDGTIFGPKSCRRQGKDGKGSYIIGAKGTEKSFDNYEMALAELARMSNPRWRRPNESGNFGIVSAEHWRRLSHMELIEL